MAQPLNLLNLKAQPKKKDESNEGPKGGTGVEVPAQDSSGAAPTRVGDSVSDAESKGVTQGGSGAEVARSGAADSDDGKPVVDSPAPVPAAKPSLLGGLKLKASTSTQAPASPKPTSAEPKSGPVDSLAALSADESTGVPTVSEIAYADEIPAQAPERQLPEGLDEQMQGFVKSLDSIYTVMDDPELFAQMIRSIMMELQSNPQYIKLICDDDVAAMIRGMRESMGLARIKKETAKAKRAGTGGAKAKKSSPKADAMLDDLAALAAASGVEFD